MDSSDSEYFESADEDMADEHIVENKEILKDDSNILHQKEHISDASNKNTNTHLVVNQGKIDLNAEVSNDSLKTTENLNINDNTKQPEVVVDNKLNNTQENKMENVLEKNVNHHVNTPKESNLDSKQNANEGNLWDDTELDWEQETKNDLNTNLNNKPEVTEEENLWNKTELDWKTKVSGNEPNENLWDDAELNWGEESKIDEKTLQNIKNVNSNTSVPVSDTWGGWGSWGSVLSTATQSVSTITTQVSQGLSTVIESSIGAVDPEEMARLNLAQQQKSKEDTAERKVNSALGESSNTFTGFGFGNLIKLVETTGNKVISGGLDTLETIGKKTFEVLQEGDPGLKKKRAFLKFDAEKVVLSQVLREAKEKAESENKILEANHASRRAKTYETLFDDHEGLVHLEALELLSKQCEIKLKIISETLSGEQLTEMTETVEQVKELCQLPDEEDEEQLSTEEIKNRLECSIVDLKIPINYDKLMAMWEDTENWLNKSYVSCDAQELHQQGIESLARLTALSVEVYHKIGELIMVKEHRSTTDEADALVQSTTTLTCLIGIAAAKFSEKLNTKIDADSKSKADINSLITNIFLEAANSSSYIQDALQLLIPVLQVGAV